MTVSTHSATPHAESAKFKPLRKSAVVRAGSYLYEGDRLVTGWHRHDVHQIEYAVGGVVDVETADTHFLLPPQQAVWIPAGLHHQATMNSNVRSIAIMFDPELVPYNGTSAAVLDVSPLIREMIVYAKRWPIDRLRTDDASERFFQTLGDLVLEAVQSGEPLFTLPTSDHPVVSAAMTCTRNNLHTVSAVDVSRAVAVSERTLRRLFLEETGFPWRTYLLHARMLRAMALLATPEQSVQETARAVGFQNVSSFARAFADFTGHSPSAYRKRSAAHSF
ncbi:AraC family transcriptional regulator [Rhodococcus sp. P1Y]|uniref:AraC family transcriptional regulator n=1 Tax=Rhodococcus sp. P1Y TaxID=1302308 RepID=UPI000EB11F94|nr:helix-turn-helix transcriptional regulator [Rhodococcus sp. P1Y]AYJ50320.1 AraC family transcriptional regulator [Rhodococcus sp. P1Y]